MHIDHEDGGAGELGYLVSNHLIRRAAFEAVQRREAITLITGTAVADVRRSAREVEVRLSDGRLLTAALLVAADSRFSEIRRRMGIAARSRDFGKTMLVARVEHARDHEQIACEWFDYGQTLALLPLPGRRSSAVITVTGSEALRLEQLEPAEYGRELERRYRGRLGAMRLVSPVFAYPLVGVLADRFTSERCALAGDAAVGMHPVTAHGFNLGLLGTLRLAELIDRAARAHRDIGAASLLAHYGRSHALATLPLYFGTNAIVSLYTRDTLPARLARETLVRLGGRVRPFRRALAGSLTRVRSAGLLPLR